MIAKTYTIHWLLPYCEPPRDEKGRFTTYRWSCYAEDEAEALYKFRQGIGRPSFGEKNITRVVCSAG